MRLRRRLLALCAALLVALAPRAAGDTAAPKAIKLTQETLESTLASLPADSYVLIEMFACVSRAPGALSCACVAPP